MASSSHDSLRGRDRRPWSSQSRQRSESRRISDRRRPVRTAAHKRDRCLGALHIGESVDVFSRTFKAWVEGEITEFMDASYVRVEYQVGGYWFRKSLHLKCEHLDLRLRTVSSAGEEDASVEAEMCSVPSLYTKSTPGSVEYSSAQLPSSCINTGGCEVIANTPPFAPQVKRIIGDRRLPEECESDPKAYYVNMDQIWKLLEDNVVVLIKGSWLLRQSKAFQKEFLIHRAKEDPNIELESGRRELEIACSQAIEKRWTPIPCRQDLPPDAIVDVSLLRQVYAKSTDAHIVAISHCWLNENHPDPESLLLDQIAVLIWSHDGMRRDHKDIGFDGAVFFAWCSMYQPYHARMSDGSYRRQESLQVSPCVQESFQNSLRNMHIWYAHSCVEKWLFTLYFDGQGKDYKDRGWPTWERTVADLLSAPGKMIEIAKPQPEPIGFFDFTWSSEYFEDVVRSGSAERRPPLFPDQFDQIIDGKFFTCEGVDRPLVKQNYRRNFAYAVSCLVNLELPAVEWEESDMQSLCSFVGLCTSIQRLDLGGTELGDCGAGRLAQSFYTCPELMHLTLDQNNIGDDGCSKLADALRSRCSNLQTIDIRDNQIRDDGASALAETFMHCICLQEIDLRDNAIGDRGARGIFRAVPHCEELRSLQMSNNEFTSCIDASCASLSCCDLKVLTLADNRIKDIAARDLGHQVLQCSKLEIFDIGSNELSPALIEELTATLREHPSLQNYRIGDKFVKLRSRQDSDEMLDLLDEFIDMDMAFALDICDPSMRRGY